ncbi:hypothetical protein CRD36_07200 [Paremcibacter congregatus]|uniref:Uncharacterized protein n=1 Tax=Paremcibacter congregatus TaxID=2043170 RepID=A0A2G4YS88_9PROT|nr:hypothetical protein CRD36_07200 [Paremcibacter congregatus]
MICSSPAKKEQIIIHVYTTIIIQFFDHICYKKYNIWLIIPTYVTLLVFSSFSEYFVVKIII